jgi:glutathione synthase/RimK-type ligase-like ATP-grasp enzyme
MAAARQEGMDPRLIDRDEYARLGEYDALFIRTMTGVNHYTYRFARRAQSEGLVVIDDPESIVRCTNKIYLAELMERYQVRTPRTLIVPRDGVASIAKEIGFPCVLKQPDGAFSLGVLKVENDEQLMAAAEGQLAKSELIVAQAFMPTDFDWRIGVMDRTPLWACRYHMARSHWQIYRALPGGERAEGRVEAIPIASAPKAVVRMAVRAAGLMGDGLYGVDLKVHRGKVYLVEVNDNPSINAGYEDRAEGDALYGAIMSVFARRLAAARASLTR